MGANDANEVSESSTIVTSVEILEARPRCHTDRKYLVPLKDKAIKANTLASPYLDILGYL